MLQPEQSTKVLLYDAAAALQAGESYPLRRLAERRRPSIWRGVYTIWDAQERFVYVGMSGRSIITGQTRRRNRPTASIRASRAMPADVGGDQFCVYVMDRLVPPTLSSSDIAAISSGEHQMDAFVRRYIHENLRYRFLMVPDGATAFRYEGAIKDGDWAHGCPLLNPSGRR